MAESDHRTHADIEADFDDYQDDEYCGNEQRRAASATQRVTGSMTSDREVTP